MKELINTIRTVRFGHEAREPVADAISQLPELFDRNAVKLPEVTQARGAYKTLGTRLNAYDQTNSDAQKKIQLAGKQLTDVAQWIEEIRRM